MSGAGAGLLAQVAAALGESVAGARPLAGGDINDAWRLELGSGAVAFVKSRPGASPADFEAEAAGLRWLADAGGAPVPAVLGVGSEEPWLALEWLEPGRAAAADEELGRGLAAIHLAGAPAHGALPPSAPDSLLRIGSVELELGPAPSWTELYGGALLLPLARRAADAGRLPSGDALAVEELVSRLDGLCGPEEPAARLHGDLWSGNVHAAHDGRAWLIDPAAYGGHREIDLAMLRLFGSPSPTLLAAYEEAHPLAPGHSERVELHQLLPLLVHAVLFGGGYGAAAGRAARRYL